jgi:hypothetical protein
MALQTVRETPRAGELLRIALGGLAGSVGGAVAGAAAFQSEVMALLGALGGAVFGLIAALKRIEGDGGDEGD